MTAGSSRYVLIMASQVVLACHRLYSCLYKQRSHYAQRQLQPTFLSDFLEKISLLPEAVGRYSSPYPYRFHY